MGNDYKQALLKCPDRRKIEKILREHSDESHPIYRPHDDEKTFYFSPTDPKADGIARFLSVIAPKLDNPIDTYICMARICGVSDAAIASVLDMTAAFVGKRRKIIASEDSTLGQAINAYVPMHTSAPQSLATSGQHPIRFNHNRRSGRKRLFVKQPSLKPKAKQMTLPL